MKIPLSLFSLYLGLSFLQKDLKVEYTQQYDCKTKKLTTIIHNHTDSVVLIPLARDYGDLGNRSSIVVTYLDEQNNTVGHTSVFNIVDMEKNDRIFLLDSNEESKSVYELIPDVNVDCVVKIRTQIFLVYFIIEKKYPRRINREFVYEYEY